MAEKKLMKAEEVAEILRNDSNEAVKMNALLGATLTILKTELKVEFVKKSDGGYTVLLIPTKVGDAPQTTIQELIDDVKGLSQNENVDVSELEEICGEKNNDGLGDIGISLSMAFLYVDANMDATSKQTKVSSMEYAFQIKADLHNVIPKEISKFVSIKNAEVAVWNTERPKIIEAMQLIKPEDYLKEFD
ncbi:hypothetical protein [Butyrivibrio sp. AE2005]|uniref:hypothetical protein n=1 Tax=Butyrivibrio sp. AE2005 TaxID=1496722 RepID=UPI00047A37EB|nr:hypothetical protein [Butyrivibrio sp. AE2005]